MPNDEPDFGDIRSAPHQYGDIVFLVSDGGQGVAEWLRPIYDLAIENKCSMIMFDSAASRIEGLKTWDW